MSGERAAHPWVLTGPWYRWAQPGDPGHGRQSRPVLQKYASPDFVNEFVTEPQRSLKYVDEDRIAQLVAAPGARRVVRTGLRKIFLTSHDRFYLVVVELHCDTPGLPAVTRDQVAEAGFVVRRVRAPVPAQARAAATSALSALRATETRLAMARTETARRPRSAARALLDSALRGPVRKRQARLLEEYLAGAAALDEVVAAHAITLTSEKWSAPASTPGVGAWTPAQDAPAALGDEAVYPLYPLIPDPQQPRHSARGRSMWFGVVPTGGGDITATGAPRFDDQHIYEIRCFVRRLREDGCEGELTWSLPTTGYRLASHFDLDGTSHRPTTVQLPDLAALEAQVRDLPPGAGMGLRVNTPPGSDLGFDSQTGGDGAVQVTSPGVGGPSICFFAIPLITIVAFFVLRLFLPVVVFLFGLWFLLRLKLCILPQVQLEAGLAAELKARFDLGLEIDAGVVLDTGVTVGAAIDNALTAHFGATGAASIRDQLPTDDEVGRLLFDLAADFSDSLTEDERDSLPPREPGVAGPELVGAPLPSVLATLEYYEVLDRPPIMNAGRTP